MVGYSFSLEFGVLNRPNLMIQKGGRGGVIILQFNCFIDPLWGKLCLKCNIISCNELFTLVYS